MKLGLLPLALSTGSCVATSPFDGAWVADLDTQSGLPIDRYLVADGQYSCDSCEPPRSYPADGKLRTVAGADEATSEATQIIDPNAIQTHIVTGALDRVTTMTVSADGQSATYISLDHRPGIRAVLKTEYLARRVGGAPPGAHPVSGSWQGVRYVRVPNEVRTTELKLVGDRLYYRTPLGTSFMARLDGIKVPMTTLMDSGYFAAVRRLGPQQIEERVSKNGLLVAIRTFTLAPDHAWLEIATTDPQSGQVFRIKTRKAGGAAR